MKNGLAAGIIFASILMLAAPLYAEESEVDRLLDLFERKGIISKEDVVQFRSEAAIKKQEVVATAKPAAPADWAQNVKWGGDVRFRTRSDWGKPTQNQPQTSSPLNASDLRSPRLQESVRGRFAIEGRVNDSTYAGARLAGGNTNPRSTDDTLTGYFNKAFVMFDQYYMRFEAPRDMVIRFGQYFSDLKLWAGKFQNPLETTEMMWDTDINPGGLALQYVSPELRFGGLPGLSAYSNIGMFWLDESIAYNTDPLLYAFQSGVKTEPFGSFGSTLNLTTTIYNFANLEGKTPNANSARTNSRTWIGDYGYGIAASSLGTYKYQYNLFEIMARLDNEWIGDCKFPHGFVLEYIYNASVSDPDTNKALLVGGYIGKKKIRDVTDWRVSAEWRYLERDAVPDFLPDSNFYGFGTYVNANTLPNVNGLPAAGGTNARGIKTTLEYQLLKNTALNLSYYWMEPIKSFDKHDPWNEVLCDVITKF